MKEIKLSQGLTVKVDDSDFEWLNQWKWFAHKAGINWYAMRNVIYEGKHTLIYMHRLIMNTQPLLQVDHIDHDGLNNQKTNLRICTLSENRRNRRLQGEMQICRCLLSGQ